MISEAYLRFLYSLSYFILTAIISAFGPKIGDPKYIVDPSSFFTFINFIYVESGFILSFLAIAVMKVLSKYFASTSLVQKMPSKFYEALIGLGATTYWILCRMLFVWIADQSGNCHASESFDRILHNRRGCLNAGGYWDGFDISGHCFLVALTCGFFFDELMIAVKSINARLKRPGLSTPELLDNSSILNLQPANEKNHGSLWASYLLCAAFTLIVWAAWSSLLLHTSLYFHTFWEKILGLFLGFTYWWTTHLILAYTTT